MKNKVLFAVSFFGVLIACTAAYIFGLQQPAQPPLFQPAANPYNAGIYAEGIIESDQANGSNISMNPEVPGTVKAILVTEGQTIHAGEPLLLLDDSIQRATTEQQQAQAHAAESMLEELRAEPRGETLAVSTAQVAAAKAALKTASDAWGKQEAAYQADPRSVSKDALDAAANAQEVARANLAVQQRQYDLIRAGAWSFDIRNQEQQHEALQRAARSASALLSKYTLRAPTDGTVLSINTTPGSFISSQGSYDLYTQGALPALVLGAAHARLHVRCYVDEILIPRLGVGKAVNARMTVRGTQVNLPLHFERIQPYVSPKIELSNQRQERVDVRVLPVIFSFDKPANANIYPGELVDVYIGS